jgi:hypothetical protein
MSSDRVADQRGAKAANLALDGENSCVCVCVCGRDHRKHLLDIGNRNSRRATELQEQANFSLPGNIGSLGWGIMDKNNPDLGWVLRYLDGDEDMIDSV